MSGRLLSSQSSRFDSRRLMLLMLKVAIFMAAHGHTPDCPGGERRSARPRKAEQASYDGFPFQRSRRGPSEP